MPIVLRLKVITLTYLSILSSLSIAQNAPQLLGVLKTDSSDKQFGRRIIPLGDQNNDGFDDILISENFRNLLFYGGNPFDTLAALIFDSTNARTNNIGDINGDGFNDFTALGRSNFNWKLNLYLGGPSVDTIRDYLFGVDPIGPIGYTVIGSDIDLNGVNEIISWEGQNIRSVLFFELESDFDSVADYELFPANDSFAPQSAYGWGIITGDFNGDTKTDLAVSYNPSSGFLTNGAVYLYWGGVGFDTIPDLILRRPGPYIVDASRYGVLLENLGDVNGDGYEDLFASSGSSVKDTVGFIYFGGSTIDSLPELTIPRSHTQARSAGDINNDGYDDLIISHPTDFSTIGWVEIYLGGPAMDSIADVRYDVRDEIGYHNYYGLDCSGIGDFNGDGIDDFAFSSGRNGGAFETYIYSGWDLSTEIKYEYEPTIPTDYVLSQNYPNPFNPSTTIEINLPTRSHVALKVLNSLGQEIALLLSKELSVGSYKITWDARDKKGNEVASGVYFYKLEAGDFVETKKMVLVR